MQAAKKQTVFEFPEGGIADFYMTDEQFAELERREEVGHGGIANVHHIADRIAEYGRYGDDTLAHVETGELIVPKALLEKNPALKESILEHLEELGVEDPERYIVGSEFNSLNPDTQLPEFFGFIKKVFKKAKKTFKKIVKGVKKTLKKIGKVLKKASAIVLPVVLNAVFPGMGAIMTGALSGGISTLIQGGNLKDALKGAAIGGVTGALVKGGYNKFTGKSNFLDTIKNEVTDLGNLKSQFSTAGGILDPARYSGAAAASPAGAPPAGAPPAGAGAQAGAVTQQPLPPLQGPPTAPPMQTVKTFDQFVNETVGKGYEIDEFGNEFFNKQLIPKGGMATQDGTVIQLASKSAEQGVVPTPGFEFNLPTAEEAFAGAFPEADKFVNRPAGEFFKTTIPTNAELLAGQSAGAGTVGAGAGTGAASTATPAYNVATAPALPAKAPKFFESLKGTVMEDTLAKGAADPYRIAGATGADAGVFENLGNVFMPNRNIPTVTEVLKANPGMPVAVAEKAVKDATAGYIRTFGPSLAVAGLAAKKAGMFDTPTYDPVTLVELEESMGGKTAEQLMEMDPSKYRIDNLGRPVIIDQTLVPSTTAPVRTTMPLEPPTYYRQGGQAFPRRTGGIDPSEGVPNQDSVRAMLMPGEFVMTTKAVRGMSRNGDSREGIRNMYSMMRNLEARERKMG